MFKSFGESERKKLKKILKAFKIIKELNGKYKVLYINSILIANKIKNMSIVTYKDVQLTGEEYDFLEQLLSIPFIYSRKNEYFTMFEVLYYFNSFYTEHPKLKNMELPSDIFNEDNLFGDYNCNIDAKWDKYMTIDVQYGSALMVEPIEEYEFDEDLFNKTKAVLGDYCFSEMFEYVNSNWFEPEYDEIYIYEIKIHLQEECAKKYGSMDNYLSCIKYFSDSWISEAVGESVAESYYNEERKSVVIVTNCYNKLFSIDLKMEFAYLIAMITGQAVNLEGLK